MRTTYATYLCVLFCLPVLSGVTLANVSEMTSDNTQIDSKSEPDLEVDQAKPLISVKPRENSALESIAKNPFFVISKYLVISAALFYGLYLTPQVRPFLLQAGYIIGMTGVYAPGMAFVILVLLLPEVTAALIQIIQPIRRIWNDSTNQAKSKFGDLIKQTHVTEELLEYKEKSTNELFNGFVEKSKAKNGDCIFTVLYGEPGTGKTALTKYLAEIIQAYYGLEEAGADSFLLSSGITVDLYNTAKNKIMHALQKDNVVFTLDDIFCGERKTAPGILGQGAGEKTSSVLTFYNIITEEIKRRKSNGEKLHNVFLFVTSNSIYDDPTHTRYMKMDPALQRRADYTERIHPLSSKQISNAVLKNLTKIHTKYPSGELKKFITDLLAGTSLDISSIQRILKRVYEAEADYDLFKRKAKEEIKRKTDTVKQVT